MLDSRPSATPNSTTTLGIDKDGNMFKESWDYVTILDMLMYLTNNSISNIAFVVH